ncbi:hypothetical protein BDR07DRAFT_1490054 [Suillus spraguei]|nr:hypothetical protein BDR07DRAFT_1490054 [Suillus spraguei]
MTQPTYAALPNGVSQGQFLPSADKFNLEVTATELMFIEHALVGSSSEDEVYSSYSYAVCYKIPSRAANYNNITSSPGSVFHESLSFDEEMSDSQHTDPVDDSILDDEMGYYADDNYADEDYAASAQNNCSDDNYAYENYTDDDFNVEEEEMLNDHQW